MADPEGKLTELNPSIIARTIQAARYVVSGVKPETWFGPAQPLKPMAPGTVAGRRYDYPYGQNLQYIPRSDENISFDAMRALAANCDILRAVIETRKDQMEGLDWNIRVRNTDNNAKDAVTDEQKKRIDDITAFMQKPDKENNFAGWLRTLLEDMFVIDGMTLYKRRDRGGRLYALEIMDGATIKPVIDDSGRTPLAPDPAFQQILHGIPAVDYTTEELIYLRHNRRSHTLYGYSQVEQIIVTTNILIRRNLYQLDYYREGSQPDAFMSMPETWTNAQIKTFQDYFDAMVKGASSLRRRLRFIPGGSKYQEVKQPPLKDLYDEFLARIICFTFSISPEPFVQHVNRATAESSHDRAQEEGLAPLQNRIRHLINPIIAEDFDSPDLEFTWSDDRETDPVKEATINVSYVKSAIMTVDEVREGLGLAPLGGKASEPQIITATGAVPLEVDPEDDTANGGLAFEDIKLPDEKSQPGEANADKTKKAAGSSLRKAGGRIIKPPPFPRPATRKAVKSLKAKVVKTFGKMKPGIAKQLRAALANLPAKKLYKGDRPISEITVGPAIPRRQAIVDAPGPTYPGRLPIAALVSTQPDVFDHAVEAARAHLRNGDEFPPVLVILDNGVYLLLDGHHRVCAAALEGQYDVPVNFVAAAKMAKADDDDVAAKIARGLDLFGLDFLADAAPSDLADVFSDTGKVMLARIGVEKKSDLVDQVFESAVDYATDRAAELVGKKYNARGQLVDNPNKKWAIDESTRNKIQDAIASGLDENIGHDAIVQNIIDASEDSPNGVFSEARAELIARTEIAMANSQGALEGMRQARSTGLTVKKSWFADAQACEICLGNVDDGEIGLDEDFSSGDDATPGHPNCECTILSHVSEDQGSSDQSGD